MAHRTKIVLVWTSPSGLLKCAQMNVHLLSHYIRINSTSLSVRLLSSFRSCAFFHFFFFFSFFRLLTGQLDLALRGYHATSCFGMFLTLPNILHALAYGWDDFRVCKIPLVCTGIVLQNPYLKKYLRTCGRGLVYLTSSSICASPLPSLFTSASPFTTSPSSHSLSKNPFIFTFSPCFFFFFGHERKICIGKNFAVYFRLQCCMHFNVFILRNVICQLGLKFASRHLHFIHWM